MASAATDPAAATVTHGAPPLRSHPSFVYDSTKVTQSGTPPHMEFWYPGVRGARALAPIYLHSGWQPYTHTHIIVDDAAGTADKIRLLIAEATSQRRITCALVVRDIKGSWPHCASLRVPTAAPSPLSSHSRVRASVLSRVHADDSWECGNVSWHRAATPFAQAQAGLGRGRQEGGCVRGVPRGASVCSHSGSRWPGRQHRR